MPRPVKFQIATAIGEWLGSRDAGAGAKHAVRTHVVIAHIEPDSAIADRDQRVSPSASPFAWRTKPGAQC